MSDVSRSLVLEFDGEIDDAEALLHVSSCDISDPSRNGGREKKDLEVLTTLASALGKNLVNFFLEALLEHLIGFIKDDGLQA